MSGPVRPERGAQLELDALLGKLQELADEGDRNRYDIDEDKIWRLTAIRPPVLRRRLREMRR